MTHAVVVSPGGLYEWGEWESNCYPAGLLCVIDIGEESCDVVFYRNSKGCKLETGSIPSHVARRCASDGWWRKIA